MSSPTPPGRRGRHASPDSPSGVPASAWLASMPNRPPDDDEGWVPAPAARRRRVDTGSTGPLPGRVADTGVPRPERPPHPSEPLPDLPPRPAGPWSRLSRRTDGDHDDATVGVGGVPAVPGAEPADTQAHAADPHGWDDADSTGGLEVLGASGSVDVGRRRRGRRAQPRHDDHDLYDHDDLLDDGSGGGSDDPPGGSSGAGRPRRRRSPLAVVLSLLVLAAIVGGIVLGGQALLGLVNPASEDYAGQGTGTVEVRVNSGDTLSDIARTLVAEDVIASVGPFVEAAETEPAATGIQPGVYSLRSQMSGGAALDLLLDPASRMVSRVAIPEGFTVEEVLARLAEETGRPLADFEAAAADPASLGLPPYANGRLEGYLFPATYEFTPDDTPTDMLRAMATQFAETADRLQLEQRAAAAGRSPSDVVTVASMVQSETRLDEERADVAQVVYNRLDQGIPLGIDATNAYGLGKSGDELTVTDLETDGPYNTRTRAGLPPTPISNPGEASLEAALAPSTGDLLYYVLESEDGSHFFTSDYAEFQAARARCAAAGLGCGG